MSSDPEPAPSTPVQRSVAPFAGGEIRSVDEDALLPAAVEVDEDALTPAAAEAVRRGWAESTHRAYDRDWRRFTTWCAAHGRTPLPATGATLANFVAELIGQRPAPATVERMIGSIQARHKAADLGINAKAARMALTGYRKSWAEGGGRVKQARAITTDQLRSMLGTRSGSGLRHLRDRAALLLGYAMLARRSELVALDLADLAFTEDGLEVFLARSKSDRQARGELVQIPYGTHRLTCTVRTVAAYTAALAQAGVDEGPLLRGIDRRGRPGGTPRAALRGSGRMSTDGLNRIIKAMAEQAGVTGVSAHSLRAGAATGLARAGVRRADIAAQGRWEPTSTAVDRYIRPAEGWEHNPLRSLDL